MDIFLLLLTTLLPLYALIGIGFAAGRWFSVDRETLANFAIYICVPAVAFGFIAQIDFRPEYTLLPMVIFVIAGAIAIAALHLGRRLYPDNRVNLMAMCASLGNMGYFGLPVVMALYDEKLVAVYMFMLLGGIIFESTAGYYMAARGHFTVRDSLVKLSKFPTIYAIALGLMVNFMHIQLPDQLFLYWEYFKGAYVIMGMMIIGAALSRVKKLIIAPKFIALSFAGKFIAWPLLAYLFIFLDRHVFGIFDSDIYHLILLMSLVPPGANIAAFASQMDLKPEKAATTVLLGTIFALFYIPAMLALLGLH